MLARRALILLMGVLPLPLAAQAPSIIPLEKEPHHQLMLRNDEVVVFKVKLLPGESLLLHRHDYDEASMTMSEGATAAILPGQPEVHQKDVSGTVRFHRAGVIHVIRNVSDTPYYLHESISLLQPQGNVRNFCAVVIESEPINCPKGENESGVYVKPQYETDRMRASVTYVPPRQSAAVAGGDRDDLIVAIDEVWVAAGDKPGRLLQPGDCVWIGHNEKMPMVENKGDKESRFATFAFRSK
jgi:hypothetical protein